MKNVTEMTIEELNAERTKLNELDQAILAGASNANEHDLYERLDLIVQEIDDRDRKEYTAQLSIFGSSKLCALASTMVLTVAFQKNRDIALASLIEKVIATDYELALQMKDILDEQIQAKDDALIGEAERNYEDRLNEMMDGDPVSALASIGWGTDEDYS
tara:strand:- start:302 stop:781 length:480 start_codon:yes stop_codon:yes gene_type:complete